MIYIGILNIVALIISGITLFVGVIRRDSFMMQLGLGLCIMNLLIGKGNYVSYSR